MFPETGFNTIKPVNSSNFLSSNRRRNVSNIRVPKRKQIICHNMPLFAAVRDGSGAGGFLTGGGIFPGGT